MHRVILAALLALTACATVPPVTGFRDPAQPIYSSAVFDPAGLSGVWTQLGDFADGVGCGPARVRFADSGGAMRIDGQLCVAGTPTMVAGPLIPTGPGRFGVAGIADPIWVLWADGDLRTLVLGTPSGRFGMILNRDAALPADRLLAARDVLAWNGYDLDRLQISR